MSGVSLNWRRVESNLVFVIAGTDNEFCMLSYTGNSQFELSILNNNLSDEDASKIGVTLPMRGLSLAAGEWFALGLAQYWSDLNDQGHAIR